MEFCRIGSLAIDADCDAAPDRKIAAFAARFLHCRQSDIAECRILRRSIDARRGAVKLLYKLELALTIPVPPQKGVEAIDGFTETLPPEPPDVRGKSVIVTGAGPGGLFAALELARHGAKVTLCERGADAETRSKDYAEFLQTRKLNPESNLLFGEGGAGTFSDGKLYTRIGDPLCGKVLRGFVEAGASPEILYLQRPHLGSDCLPQIVMQLRRKLEEAGGTVLFHTKVQDILCENGVCQGVVLADRRTLLADAVLLAYGLGGRELTAALMRHGVACHLKGFQIGCRIVHPQKLIDRHQYHGRRPRALGAAEYNLAVHPPCGFSVGSFCMCPGGTVVNASAWPGRALSNGMSRIQRDGKFANSALIITLEPEIFPSVEAAYAFLEECETKAFAAGGSDYSLGAQSARGFLSGKEELLYESSDCGVDCGVKSARLDLLLPIVLRRALQEALPLLERKFPGFIEEGQFAGIETCVSSPVAFECGKNGESSLAHLYLCGEGAGRAGGIVSAAVDGLRCAAGILHAFAACKSPCPQYIIPIQHPEEHRTR